MATRQYPRAAAPCSPGPIRRAAAVLARYPLALRVDAQARSRRSNPSSSPRMNRCSRCARVACARLFSKGEDPSAGKPGFWDELLLLRVNAQYLEVHLVALASPAHLRQRCVMLSSEEQLLGLRDHLHIIFSACLIALRDENRFRVIHALEARPSPRSVLTSADVCGVVAAFVSEEVE